MSEFRSALILGGVFFLVGTALSQTIMKAANIDKPVKAVCVPESSNDSTAKE